MMKFSVIIPVYNVEKYLAECLEHLLAQTLPKSEFEIICIDDGCTDSSGDILKKYKTKCRNIRVITQTNQGQSVGRNKGIKVAKGEYIYFHDSDDYLLPESLEELYDRASRDNLDMLFFQLCAFGDGVDDKTVEQWSKWYVRKKEYPDVYSGKEIYFAMRDQNDYRCNVPGFIIRRSLIKKAKLLFFPGIVHQDELFTFQAVLKAGRTGYTPKQYYQRRIRPNSVITASSNFEDVRGCLVVAYESASTLQQDAFTDKELKVLDSHIRSFLNLARERYVVLPFSERQKLEGLPMGMQMKIRLLLDLTPGSLLTYDEQRKRDEAEAVVKKVTSTTRKGAYVYGVGNHLDDMLKWHPELKRKIARVFDKSTEKIGKKVDGLGLVIEHPKKLCDMSDGTIIIIAAIRYFDEIVSDIKKINSKLQCLHMDEAYRKGVFDNQIQVENVMEKKKIVVPKPETKAKTEIKTKIEYKLTGQQKKQLRGLKQVGRWRQRLLIDCHGRQKIFWGTHGARAERLRQELAPLRAKGDFYIDENQAVQGRMLDGLPVCKPSALSDAQDSALIIVLSGDYQRISNWLQADGLVENVDFVEGRKLLGLDEHGYIDVPCVDKSGKGMIIYGYGAHILDMVKWHPELKNQIRCVVDKDTKKHGQYIEMLGCRIESPDILSDLPAGTEIAVAAIRYFSEIERDAHSYNPWLLVRNIDEIWREYMP